MENFTPVSGLIGGLLIGLATVLLLLFNGKIAGISGIVGGLLTHKGSEVGWRAVFIEPRRAPGRSVPTSSGC